MEGVKVVKPPEGPYAGLPHRDGRIIELRGECCQVQVFEIFYGLKLTGSDKGGKLAQVYLKGLDGAA
jgi:hypothetical protein